MLYKLCQHTEAVPVRSAGSFRAKRAVILGISAVLLAVGVIVLMGWLARSGVISPNSRGGALRVGIPEQIAAAIDDGGPILFPDPLGGDRQRILHHLGDDLGTGWYAFDARRAGAESNCLLRWQPAARVFVDTCNGEIVEANGEGLTQYEVRIREGRLEVDFGSPLEPTRRLPG